MSKKTIKPTLNPLDQEEQEILDLFEEGKLKSSKNAKQEIAIAKKAATNYINAKKNARINIRLSSDDLDKLKSIAVAEGLPYQTLIASVLHKYIASKL